MIEENKDSTEPQASLGEVETNSIPSELDTLKARADLMGLSYHPNIGVDKLKERIEASISGESVTEEAPVAKTTPEDSAPPAYTGEVLTAAEFKMLQVRKRRQKAGSLVRIRLVCMNPNKKDWEGEIFSVGSAKLGTFKKFVPFNGDEEGYHVPQIMLDMIRERKCSIFQTVKGPKGNKIRKAKLVPEFSVEELEPLTKDQLKDLAQQQAMSGSLLD